jgi:hypothetical protein
MLLVCSWPHSVGQNHFFVKMLLNRDSAIQSASRRFYTVYKSEKSDPLQPSRRCDIPSGRPHVQSIFRPNEENFPSGPSSMLRSLKLLQLASVRTFQQHVRTTLGVRPAMGFPSKTQIWEDCCNCPDNVDSHPNTLIHKASIAFKIQTSRRQSSWSGHSTIRSTVRTTIPLVRTYEALVWKLHAAKVRLSGRQGTTVRTQLKSGKNFSEILEKRSHSCLSRRPMNTVRTAPRFYQARRSFEPAAYK